MLSWDDGNSTYSQEIPCTVWNQKVLYHGHKSTSLVAILSQINSIHTIPSYFSKIHFNIILPSMPRYSKWPLCFRFPHKTLQAFLFSLKTEASKTDKEVEN